MYTAHRDERFEYVHEIMSFIEDNQCSVCVFRKSSDEYPMCVEIETPLSLEEPVAALDDKGVQGVVCNVFKLGNPAPPVDPDQLLLGE